tara:strand:- start:1918 stop:2067 length:150 start_codon:yes stop_codon:yes gene_type:complete
VAAAATTEPLEFAHGNSGLAEIAGPNNLVRQVTTILGYANRDAYVPALN